MSTSRSTARALALAVLLSGAATAQYAERPDPAGSGRASVDVSGRSIKNPRVRAIHSDDPTQAGGTADLFEHDPFLAYQLGRNINFREFRERDGVFTTKISDLGGPMPDGTTAKITANNQVSCSGCHNLPQGNPGGGVTFHKDSGFGRNSPHYYGAGIMEMLAIQTRTKMMRQLDTNGDGWIHANEANNHGPSIAVRPSTFALPISYGDPRLSSGTTGSPSLNNIFRVWYVDANGQVVDGATQVDGTTTVGYNFEMVVWGWGQGVGRSALNPTNRAFLWDPFNAHGGLQAYDPSTNDDPDGDGVSEPTLAGAIQFPATHRAPDAGNNIDARGFSRDDPDGDGHLSEISEGDLDVGEWFMLNAPRPAFAGSPWEFNVGVQALTYLGCTTCHTPNWYIEARDTDPNEPHPFAGDRRFIDLLVTWDSLENKLKGNLLHLYDRNGEDYNRRFGAFPVYGLFSDLRHHEMGEGFKEVDFGGNMNTTWRTPPLWGVGSGFPWGHDGQSLTLDHVIRRHGGAALASRRAYEQTTPWLRTFVVDFLTKLQLYDVESLPADIDGDGAIASDFAVAGKQTGVERFNAEWLFRTPLQIQGAYTNTDGATIRSFAGVNVHAAYGLGLPLRMDSDLDGWPDVWDAAPQTPGYRDGVQ